MNILDFFGSLQKSSCFDGAAKMSLHSIVCSPSSVSLGQVTKTRPNHRARPRAQKSHLSVALQVTSVLLQTDDDYDKSGDQTELPNMNSNTLLTQPNTVGIIGGVSAFSTLIFLEKLVWWGSRCGSFCPPFVVCSDSTLHEKLRLKSRVDQANCFGPVVESLKRKRAFLEESGASCVVMPCHLSHVWHREISEGCSLPFLHVGECVARELSEAKFKPLEVGGNVKIGVLATNEALVAGIYQEKLESQGFEVVLPDKSTKEHIVTPSMEALKSGDVKGARNLLKVALQILLMRAVNTIIIASDELQGLLPHDDPLLKKCTDPMDALARSALKWAKSKEIK